VTLVRQAFKLVRFRAIGVSLFIVSLTAVLGAASASTEPALDAADRCIVQTNAPGTYVIASDQGMPQVVAGRGGTSAGARATNNCLPDAYGVQCGASPSGAVAPTGTTSIQMLQSLLAVAAAVQMACLPTGPAFVWHDER
jgi:hypothetical protein